MQPTDWASPWSWARTRAHVRPVIVMTDKGRRQHGFAGHCDRTSQEATWFCSTVQIDPMAQNLN